MMAILPFFADSVTSELFLKRRQPNSLWMSSGLNVLSPLHCVSSWVSPMRISGQLSRSVWMYFRSSLLVRGCGFTCTSDLVGYGVFFGSISSMILVGFLIPHTMCLLGSYPGYQRWLGGWGGCGGYRNVLLLLVPHYIYIWYVHISIVVQVFHPVVNGEVEVGERYDDTFVVSNVATSQKSTVLAQILVGGG